MTTAALAWMAYARSLIGVRELPGAANSPVIARWLKLLRAWWADDATPWCGTFVAHIFQHAGVALPKHWYRARAWLAWGSACSPAYGAVCILSREGGGHVFLVSRVSRSFIWGVGGNQGDAVSEAKFARSRVLGFRWPPGMPLPLPLSVSADESGSLSRNEA